MTKLENTIEILLVEDNPGDVHLARKAFKRLENASVSLNVAKDGEAAIEYLDRCGQNEDEAPEPQLILLDINLPKVNGLDVLVHIKQSTKLRHIPVVMLTSSDRNADVTACYKAHANSYISKPPDFNALLNTMKWLEGFWFAAAALPTTAEDG